ncbi:hypothetical protein [Cohnella silvisoli]|uniref:Phage gp6-like head-tail connector protein n=1 Tax=Cohnella silvisoli TaxID=2873699 RepID=A0ABV1L218_9BACL|nr:hypothetical protein [Cohnella silvisoli]MCD9025754.1 hypothetical protein [Cohnella silvisoli]
MTPTPDILTELRELLDEEIPVNGTEADTAFTNSRLSSILSDSVNIYAAAAEGWRRKAAKIQKKLDGIGSYQVGTERYEYISLSTALAAALKVASTFEEQAVKKTPGISSMMFKLTPPEVL